jgi:hypothetical protein
MEVPPTEPCSCEDMELGLSDCFGRNMYKSMCCLKKINIKKSYRRPPNILLRILLLSSRAHVNIRAVSPCNSLISVLFVVGQVSTYNHLLSTVSLLTPYTVPRDRCTLYTPCCKHKEQNNFKGRVSWDFLKFHGILCFGCLAERFRKNVSVQNAIPSLVLDIRMRGWHWESQPIIVDIFMTNVSERFSE